MRFHRIGAALLSTVLAASGVGYSTSQASGTTSTQTVNIGIIVPLSGANATVGAQSLNAAKLAVDDINASGGIKALGGAKLHLVVADSGNDPSTAVTASERVLTQYHLAGVYGLDLSPLCTAAMPLFIRANMPLVGACISNSLVAPSEHGDYFMVVPEGTAFGDLEVQFVVYLNTHFHLGIKKIAIAYIDNPYGESTAQGILAEAKKDGFDILLDTAYPSDITDAVPLATKVASTGAQVLFATSYVPDAELITTAMHDLDPNTLVVGGGAGYIWPPIGRALHSTVNGLTSVASWNFHSRNITTSPSLLRVTQRYEKAYGTFMPEQAGAAYAGIWILADAVEHAKSAAPASVKAALHAITVTSGGGSMMQPGKVGFTSGGANKYVTPVIIQWQDGVPQTVFPLNVATARVERP